jgi:hypothetical protein
MPTSGLPGLPISFASMRTCRPARLRMSLPLVADRLVPGQVGDVLAVSVHGDSVAVVPVARFRH